MFQTYLPLVEFYKKYLIEARKRGFLWSVFLLSRKADTEEIYQEIIRDWKSLDDITGKRILFIFSCEGAGQRSPLLRTRGCHAVVNPFISADSTMDCGDDKDYYESKYVRNAPIMDLADLHTKSISDMVQYFNISETAVPSLVLTNLMSGKNHFVPIVEGTNIYKLVKQVVSGIGNVMQEMNRVLEIDKDTKGACSGYLKYLNLFETIKELLPSLDEFTRIAVSDILEGGDYTTYKNDKRFNVDKEIKNKIRKIINYRRHFYLPYVENEQVQATALLMKRLPEYLDQKMEQIIKEILSKRLEISNADKLNSMNEIKKIENLFDSLMDACIKIQRNLTYKNAAEDVRNDFIRDILQTAGKNEGYDVNDQTRQGISSCGKASGELDFLVHDQGGPIAVIEALNLNAMRTSYITDHINKIFKYDTAGNVINFILVYVTVKDFGKFWDRYVEFINSCEYKYPLISIDKNTIKEYEYTDVRYMIAKHKREGRETYLCHICINI